MRKAIYYRLITLTFAAIIICGFVSAMIYAVYTQNQTKEWLTKLTLSTAENYKYNTDVLLLSKSAGNNRITIIAPDGKVLADSEAIAADMENHADREEVKFARAGNVYVAMRTSHTVGEKFMYASIKTGDGNILRLAHSYLGLFHNLTVQLPAFFAAILAALILSLFLAGRFVKAVTSPLEKVVDALSVQEYEELHTYKSPYYEIDKMMLSIQALLQKIADSNKKLRDEREKVNYILSNMAEGFVLLDSNKNILLCNNSAREFFSCGNDLNLENIYHLTRNKNIIDAIQMAIDNEQSSMFDMKLREGLITNIYISPSMTMNLGGSVKSEIGVTMLIVDMTAERQLEQQKRDFFSNASHELKTPITSILGFSEMLNKGIVKNDSEKNDIMNRIETETKRLSELVNDILTISKLESNLHNNEHLSGYTDFNFIEVIHEAADSISPVKDNTTIEISMDLENILYCANRRQIYELCVNLIENAVKYNKPDGKVYVFLKKEDQNVVLTVKDTGIGIPPEYQARVFERFFRVDYGRDKKIGGTGLGLSIVKHIVSIYGGKISLQSKKDEGTVIMVTLPGLNEVEFKN